MRYPKTEIRSPRQGRSQKSEFLPAAGLRYSVIGIRISFGIRPSVFGFSPQEAPCF